MKYFTLLVSIVVSIVSCETPGSSEESIEQASMTEESITYDSLMAQSVGADDYGMRQYFIANLLKGPKRDQDSATAAQIQRAHLDNITRMAEEGKLVLAGPYLDDGEVMGIYVFAVESLEEAEKLTATDPAVKAGRLIMELHPWYGSAALMKVNELHKKVSKEAI